MGSRRHSPCADCAAHVTHHPCVHARQLCHTTNWCTRAPRAAACRSRRRSANAAPRGPAAKSLRPVLEQRGSPPPPLPATLALPQRAGGLL
jgi:hypothetical protein